MTLKKTRHVKCGGKLELLTFTVVFALDRAPILKTSRRKAAWHKTAQTGLPISRGHPASNVLTKYTAGLLAFGSLRVAGLPKSAFTTQWHG